MSYYADKLALAKKWAWKDTETSNHYYALTPLNREYLAHAVSQVTGAAFDQVIGYFEELESDADLKHHIESGLKSANYGRDIVVQYGRRLGWYAFVRAMKPDVIIETGVDHGFSLFPSEHKCYHLLLLEDGSGQIAAMPNNRIVWKDKSFVKPRDRFDYRVMAPITWHAEEGRRNPQETAITKDQGQSAE